MKKLFTLLSAAFLALSGLEAQTLSFSHNGEAIANGSTFTSERINELYAELGIRFFDPEIVLTCDADAEVVVQVDASATKDAVQFCGNLGDGGQCITASPESNYLLEKSGTFSSGKGVNLLVEYNAGVGSMTDGKIYTIKAKVSAWVKGKDGEEVKEDDKVSFNLVMTNDDNLLSVEGIQAHNERAVKLIGQDLVYDFARSSARTLSVYGLSGEKVMQENLASAQGRVSLASLSKGLWLYCIEGADGKVSGKVVLKK